MSLSARQILEEYIERFGGKRDLTRLRDPEFSKQIEVLSDRKSRYKGVNCTRRSGKSFTECIDHMEICEQYPSSRNIYAGITLDSVTEICWDIFKDLNRIGNYRCKFNETKKIIFFPNGSRIRLMGLDVSEKQMRKVLGQSLRKVSIDEAGSITQDMKKIVYQMIKPALADNRPNSWLTLLGTCENIPNTFFEEVTEGREKDVPWKVHKWTAYENPHMAKQWKEEIDEAITSNPDVVKASWFKTHYLNEWCADDDLLIIPAKEIKWTDFVGDELDYTYVLGVDLGYNDANAFTIIACHEKRREAIVVKAFKEAELILSEVAQVIKKLQKDYNISKIIIDGANKQGVEEIRKRFGIPLEIAEKQGKATYLHLLKDDILTGNVLLDRNDCGELFTEWSSLMWKDSNKDKEDDRCQNHLSDSTLYAWRFCYHYLWSAIESPPDENSSEFMEELEEREARELERELKEQELY